MSSNDSELEPDGWRIVGLPDDHWVNDLKGHTGTLANFAKDPETFIRRIIATGIVGGIIAMTTEVLDAILALIDAVIAIPVLIASLFLDAGDSIGAPLLALAFDVQQGIHETALAFGPAAIIVETALYVVLAVVAWRAVPPALSALSDALGAIPIVGSLIDAVLTFLIGFTFGGD